MKKRIFLSGAISLVFIIAPSFLLNFEVHSKEEYDGVIKQKLDGEYQEVSGSEYDRVYEKDSNEKYNYEYEETDENKKTLSNELYYEELSND